MAVKLAARLKSMNLNPDLLDLSLLSPRGQSVLVPHFNALAAHAKFLFF